MTPYLKTEDNLEMQIGVNHFGNQLNFTFIKAHEKIQNLLFFLNIELMQTDQNKF